MTVFAGVVDFGNGSVVAGAARSMLSYVVAPRHTELKHFSTDLIDVAAKGQASRPEYYEDETLCVVACARFDDLRSLNQQLGISNQLSNSGEIIALGYKQWGEALPEHIFGEFAFAVWNKSDYSLFCGRDRFGQMPLAYMVTETGILFSTDFLAIAMGAPKRPEVNDAWIIGYINQTVLDEESTPFSDIKRLPPSCVMTWRNGCFKIRKYWSFEDVAPSFESIVISDLSELLEASVRNRISDSDIVAMLSGGLDSSSIAVVARDFYQSETKGRLPTISLTFDDLLEEDELTFIESVLDQGGYLPHFVDAREYDAVAEIERLVRIDGGPTSGMGSPILDQAISKAEQLGFSSVLDGHGGDEVISGFGALRLFELAGERKWLSLLRELHLLSQHDKGISRTSTFAALYGGKGRSVVAKLIGKVHWRLRAKKKAPTRPSLLRSTWKSHPAVSSVERLAKSWLGSSHENERSFHEAVLTAPLQTEAFESLHRLYRVHGIRPVIPFWDQRVVEYCIKVPSNEKLKNGMPRSLIRSVMGNRLPRMVATRTSKFDFADAHLQSFQSSDEELRRIASDTTNQAFQYVDRDALEAAISDLNHEKSETRKQAHREVWTALNLILWFDMIGSNEAQRKGSLGTKC